MAHFSQHIRLFPESGRVCNECWSELPEHEKGKVCENKEECEKRKRDFVVYEDWNSNKPCIHYNWSGTWFPLNSQNKEIWSKCAKGCGREGPNTNSRYGMCITCHNETKRIKDEVYNKIFAARTDGQAKIHLQEEDVAKELTKKGYEVTPSARGGWDVWVFKRNTDTEEAFEDDFRERLNHARDMGRPYIYIKASDEFINKLLSYGHKVCKHKSQWKVST
nr:hypothetical protein Cbor_40 [Cedratvirus borely]